jgi:hypothetical protein
MKRSGEDEELDPVGRSEQAKKQKVKLSHKIILFLQNKVLFNNAPGGLSNDIVLSHSYLS